MLKKLTKSKKQKSLKTSTKETVNSNIYSQENFVMKTVQIKQNTVNSTEKVEKLGNLRKE